MSTEEKEKENDDNEFISKVWFQHFIENKQKYKDFDVSDVHSMALRFLFMNHSNEVIQINHDILFLNEANTISCEELIYMIQKHSLAMKNKYLLQHIIKYTSNISSSSLLEENSIKEIQYTDDDYIYLNPCVPLFNDLNEIIFLFQEKHAPTSKTKNKNNKFIHLSNEKRKTRRNVI
jgi:hypothetical protein